MAFPKILLSIETNFRFVFSNLRIFLRNREKNVLKFDLYKYTSQNKLKIILLITHNCLLDHIKILYLINMGKIYKQ